MSTCEGCNLAYCDYHSQQAGYGCVQGGHICSVSCDTSAQYRNACNGKIRKCPDCDYRFCTYHFNAVSHAAVLTGGHVCNTTTGGEIANVAGQVAYYGGAVAVAATGGGAIAVLGAAVTAGAIRSVVNNCGTCNTSSITKAMCQGGCDSCQHCNASYCVYHRNAVDDIDTLAGGHVCPAITKNYQIGAAIGRAPDIALAVNGLASAAGGLASATSNFELAKGTYETASAANDLKNELQK